jgi:two-component system, NarL family, sensor histidine kinase UhpB
MFRKTNPAFRLAILYLLVSATWILGSDWAVVQLTGNDHDLLYRIESIKGLSFIGICSILLYLAAKRLYKNSTSALEKSEELLKRYQALSQASKEGFADHDYIADKAEINEQMKFFMEAEGNEVEHFRLKLKKRMHPDDYPRVYRNFIDTVNKGSDIWQAEYRILMLDGSYHDVTQKAYLMRNRDQELIRVISAFQDVSEARNMRTAYLRQELKHKIHLGQSILRAEEDERNRWAEELHDNVCQNLTVAKLYIGQMSSDPSTTGMFATKTSDMVSKALNDIRQLSATIKPPGFSNLSMEQALEELFDNVRRVKTYQVKMDFSNFQEERLLEEHKLLMYRVVQEQLSNIIKYAQASTITVVAQTIEGDAYISIEDNGKGFDLRSIKGGIGLKNIQSRLEVFSGCLEIDAAPGKGCRIKARFSLLS